MALYEITIQQNPEVQRRAGEIGALQTKKEAV